MHDWLLSCLAFYSGPQGNGIPDRNTNQVWLAANKTDDVDLHEIVMLGLCVTNKKFFWLFAIV